VVTTLTSHEVGGNTSKVSINGEVKDEINGEVREQHEVGDLHCGPEC